MPAERFTDTYLNHWKDLQPVADDKYQNERVNKPSQSKSGECHSPASKHYNSKGCIFLPDVAIDKPEEVWTERVPEEEEPEINIQELVKTLQSRQAVDSILKQYGIDWNSKLPELGYVKVESKNVLVGDIFVISGQPQPVIIENELSQGFIQSHYDTWSGAPTMHWRK